MNDQDGIGPSEPERLAGGGTSSAELKSQASQSVLVAEIVGRGELLRRNDLWMTALIHAASLVVVLLILVVLFNLAKDIWPALQVPQETSVLNVARLGLLVMAAWIFLSTARRMAQTRQSEFDLLRAEISEIRQRTAHS